jgi:hypothetical protein
MSKSHLETELHDSVGADLLLFTEFLAKTFVDEEIHGEGISSLLEPFPSIAYG